MVPRIRPYRENIFDVLYQWFWTFFLSGAPYEYPCVTHRFNHLRLAPSSLQHYDESGFVEVGGDPRALSRSNWRWHFPVFGGWKQYVALAPQGSAEDDTEWFLGWECDDGRSGCSRVPMLGTCRARIGPDTVRFFGLSKNGDQIPIRHVADGSIGERGPAAETPLV